MRPTSMPIFVCAVTVFFMLTLGAGFPIPDAQATPIATFVVGPISGDTFPNFGENRLYQTASVTVPVDPSQTAWIAWNDTPSVVGDYLGPGGFGTDDFISLTVTNPASTALTLNIDWNDASGNSSGPQNVIFGEADDAPDVNRSSTGPINEGGAFNSVFTISGNYTFKFDFYNDHSYSYGHGNIYLLVEPIPEPSTLCLAVFGLIGLASRAWWRRPWK